MIFVTPRKNTTSTLMVLSFYPKPHFSPHVSPSPRKNTVRVSNVPEDLGREDIERAFERAGKVLSCLDDEQRGKGEQISIC
jgi:hypothetical protein